ncbi:MAG: hypothetical protein RL497_2764, partial [Pseudomonadota bacterium]
DITGPVTLTDELKNTITITSSGAFSFNAGNYKAGDTYNVSIASADLKQNCKLFNQAGVFANQDIGSVQLFCYPRTDLAPVKVDIGNLKGTLELELTPEHKTFIFSSVNGGPLTKQLAELPLGTAFSIAIKTQPEAQQCDVINISGPVVKLPTFVLIHCKDTSFQYELSGSVSGNIGKLQLSDGLGGSVTVEGEKPFSFGRYKNGSQYSIAVETQPNGMNCSVINGSGTLESNINNVKVVCQLSGMFLAGTATGISSPVILKDGNSNQVTISQDGIFYFPANYKEGAQYSVAVDKLPDEQTCEVFYGKGILSNKGVSDVQLVCHTKDTQLTPCGPPISTYNPKQFVLNNKVFNFGEGLGLGGFNSFDSNLNGYAEILFGQGSGFGRPTQYSVIEYRPASNTYDALCSSSQFEDFIAKVVPFKNNKYRAASLIALEKGEVQIINHTAGTVVEKLQTAMPITDVAVGDLDNDGNPDIAVLSETSLALYDANSFILKQSINLGGKSLAIGRFTQNTKYELAINRGFVLQFDQTGYKTLWDNSSVGFGDAYIAAGDINADGLDEIVAADYWYAIRAFNAVNRGILWDFNPGIDISALRVFDTNNDGVAEVLYGDRQHGATHILKGVNAKEEQSYGNLNSGVTDIYVADLDNDGHMEMIRGTGSNSTAEDFLDIIDLVSQKTEWINNGASGSFQAIAMGDLNGDKVGDYVYVTGEGSSGSTITAINGVDNTVLWTNKEITNLAFGGGFSLAIGDVDSNGISELIVGTDYLYDGRVYLLDGKSGKSDSRVVKLDSGSPVVELEIADIDNDGTMEIIAGAGVAHTGSAGAKIHIIDGPSFTYKQALPRLATGFGDITSMEVVKGEGNSSAFIAAIRGRVYLQNPISNTLAATLDEFTALAKIGSKIFASKSNGELHSIAADGTTSLITTLCTGSISAMEAINNSEIAFVCQEKLGIHNLSTNETTWQTTKINSSLGLQDSLVFGQIGNQEVLLAGGNVLYYFRRALQ